MIWWCMVSKKNPTRENKRKMYCASCKNNPTMKRKEMNNETIELFKLNGFQAEDPKSQFEDFKRLYRFNAIPRPSEASISKESNSIPDPASNSDSTSESGGP